MYFLRSEAPTASLALGAINRECSRPWAGAEHLGDFVSFLESAWEPSNSYVLDSDHPIELVRDSSALH